MPDFCQSRLCWIPVLVKLADFQPGNSRGRSWSVSLLGIIYFTCWTGEADFICNLKTCRRPLVNAGCVTSCSHMLCEEDGKGILQADGESKCPVCDTSLPNKYDVVHVNLNPSEEYKSVSRLSRPHIAHCTVTTNTKKVVHCKLW